MKILKQYFLMTLMALISVGSSQWVYAAAPLFGIWNGMLSNEQGEIPFELAISRDGHYVFGYIDNEIFQVVEFKIVGQKVVYIPTGGGRGELRLAYLDERDDGMTIIIEEQTQQFSPTGFLNETYSLIGIDVNLLNQSLKAILVINAKSNTETEGLVSGETVLNGILQADTEFAEHGSGKNDTDSPRFFEDLLHETHLNIIKEVDNY